jgi:TonB-linked SusC/RagA family outer membrane protein
MIRTVLSLKRACHKWRFAMYLSLIFCFPLTLLAQNKITGVVKDEGNQTVPGVTIRIIGQSTATTTSVSGQFTLAANPGDTIMVSSIGYETLKLLIRTQKVYTISLKSLSNQLSDVVILAYGKTSKRLVSNAITTISAKQIEDLPVASPAEAMVGLTPGVTIATPSGEPGSTPYIRVRGLGSLGAGNNPLFVVDGYPLNSPDNFYNINSQDIESIQVLKDAASSAMYGSRGGNGIVLVTTKRAPGNGKIKYAFNIYTGFANPSKEVKVLDGPQYVSYLKDGYTNAGQAVPAVYLNPPQELANTNWQKEIFRTAIQNNFSLSASGGNEQSRFYISGNYFSQQGTVNNSGLTRMLLRLNYDAKLSQRLKIGLTLAPSISNTYTQPISGSFNSAVISGGGPANLGAVVVDALLLPPTWAVRTPNGDYTQALNTPFQVSIGGLFNPIGTLDLYKDRTKAFRGLGYFFAEYELVKGLTLRTNLGGEIITNRRNWYLPATLATNASPTANLSNPILSNINARSQNNTSTNWLWENLLTYTHDFGADHHFTILGGYSAQRNDYEGLEAFGQGGTYTNAALQYVTAAGQIFGTAAATSNALLSTFTRLDYNYKYRYILSGSLRRDGSSRFGSDNKYATFPAASFGWRISEEPFMNALKSGEKLSELKFKASYGLTGNNNIGDYNWQSYQTPANAVLGSGNGNLVFGLVPNSVPIKNLSWEKTKQIDAGLELGLLKNKIYITADLYQRNTTSLLLNRNVPAVIGYTTRVFSNVGEIQNKGFDLAINTQNIVHKNFSWTTDANISMFRNKVVALANPGDQILFDAVFGYTSSIRVVQGQSMGSFYGYRQIGVYKDAADVAASPKWTAGGSAPGDIKYEDVNGDGKIDANDITLLGSPFPKFSYGMTNTFKYRNLTFSVGLQGNYGGLILNAVDRYTYNFYGKFNSRIAVLNRWRSPQDQGDGMTPRVTVNTPSSLTSFSSRELFDASFPSDPQCPRCAIVFRRIGSRPLKFRTHPSMPWYKIYTRLPNISDIIPKQICMATPLTRPMV